LINYRGGPKTSDYLSRFFSNLDISGAIFGGGETLIKGNYWLEDEAPGSPEDEKAVIRAKPVIPNFPAYDPEGVSYKPIVRPLYFANQMR